MRGRRYAVKVGFAPGLPNSLIAGLDPAIQ
jgi:hypothetical protein